jgi:hypothetical protein
MPGCTTAKFSIASIAAVIVLLLLVFGATLLGLSIRNIGPQDLVVQVNAVTNAVSNTTLDQGRQAVNPASVFYYFNRTYIPIILNTTCLTQDGLVLRVTVTTQYRLNSDLLPQVFLTFGQADQITTYITNVAIDSTLAVCSNYTVETGFIAQRDQVAAAMLANFQARLSTIGNFTDSQFWQLGNVAPPTDLLTAISNAGAVQQQIVVAQNQRQENITAANSNYNAAVKSASVTIINAQATASSNLIVAQQVALGETERWSQLSVALKFAQTALGFNATQFVNLYMPQLLLLQAAQQIGNIVLSSPGGFGSI